MMPVELCERVDVAGLAAGNQIGGIPVGPVHRQSVRRDGWRGALLHGTKDGPYRGAVRPFHRRRSKSSTRAREIATPSAARRARLRLSRPPYFPIRPPAAMTRWQGTSGRLQPLMMFPTARPARGAPAMAATSPYVATRPSGIRRTVDSTRDVKFERDFS